MLTYNMTDIDMLFELNHCLKDVYDETLRRIPKKEGLVSQQKRDTTVTIARRRIKRAKSIL